MLNSKISYRIEVTFHYFSDFLPTMFDLRSNTNAAAYTFVSFLLVKMTLPLTG